MSAVPAISCILAEAIAVAEVPVPVWRPKPVDGLIFYRKHTLSLLQRYLVVSTLIGRSPSLFGQLGDRGRTSSYRLRTFEDGIIFAHDVEKAIHQLEPVARAVVIHIALEDYTFEETAVLIDRSRRTVARIYGDAMNRLTAILVEFGLLRPDGKTCQEGKTPIESNDAT